jgi:hypothetical protein
MERENCSEINKEFIGHKMILVLLPAYNEEESLPKFIPKLVKSLTVLNEGYKLLVC